MNKDDMVCFLLDYNLIDVKKCSIKQQEELKRAIIKEKEGDSAILYLLKYGLIDPLEYSLEEIIHMKNVVAKAQLYETAAWIRDKELQKRRIQNAPK